MRRIGGIAFGIATQAVFLATVWRLFAFLAGGHANQAAGPLWLDALLALQFAVPHSVLLHPAIRRRLARWIGDPFYGCFYCVATCAGLWLLFAGWRASPICLWKFDGSSAGLLTAGFYAAWAGLFYSLALTGLGYQTGLTPWLYWLRRLPAPRREFRPRGAYRWLRHPVYLSFLGLLWFTPAMTLDRAVLVSVWTAYIFVGSCLKDARLLFYLGEHYRRYAADVPGYPGVSLGPLARWSSPQQADEQIVPTGLVPSHRTA